MIGLTAKQQAFINAHKEHPEYSIAQLYYVTANGSLEGYENSTHKQIQKYSQAGGQIKNALMGKGHTIQVATTSNPYDKIGNEVKKLDNLIKEHDDILDKQKLLKKFADNINKIVDKSKFKKMEEMNLVEKETFADNCTLLYDMLDSGQLENLNTKESQSKFLSSIIYYSTSIERNLIGSNENGYVSKSYMRHPQIAVSALKLLCEITGTLQTAPNINIQVNNILQEIEQKRLKELTDESLIVDDKVIK